MFKSNTLLYQLWYYPRKIIRKEERVIPRDQCVYIDGFPRSGNTFATNMVKMAIEGIQPVSHLHAVAPLKLALRRNIPTLILIRHPLDSIISLYIMETKKNNKTGFDAHLASRLAWDYIEYYRFIYQIKSTVCIYRFEHLVEDPLKLCRKVVEITGVEIDDNILIKNIQSTESKLEQKNKNQDADVSSYPKKERLDKKQALMKDFSALPEIEIAQSIYQKVINNSYLQVNVKANSGSTGKIAETIGMRLVQSNQTSMIAFGRGKNRSHSQIIKIGGRSSHFLHLILTRILDRHGFGSYFATKKFIRKINEIPVDLIHLHNLHGYYINIKVLFNYLKKNNLPVVWTLHDCWPFTGHCSHFEYENCYKWETECHDCPARAGYPASWLVDSSRKNFRQKKHLFNQLNSLVIVTPSNWLENQVKKSYLSVYPVRTIHNGIDTSIFKPGDPDIIREKLNLNGKKIILGVSNVWGHRKGLDDFLFLNDKLGEEYVIILVGVRTKQIESLPEGIIGITRTENQEELALYYSAANVFVNPTYVDNFPSTNIEALACGTPVITYRTGGSPEAVDDDTGVVVDKGNRTQLIESILKICVNERSAYLDACRKRALKLFDARNRIEDYMKLYGELTGEVSR